MVCHIAPSGALRALKYASPRSLVEIIAGGAPSPLGTARETARQQMYKACNGTDREGNECGTYMTNGSGGILPLPFTRMQ